MALSVCEYTCLCALCVHRKQTWGGAAGLDSLKERRRVADWHPLASPPTHQQWQVLVGVGALWEYFVCAFRCNRTSDNY